MNFIVSATTDIGNTKDTNQDSYTVRVYTTELGKVVLAVLCDGMGGLAKGEIASGSLVYAFCNWADTRLPVLCHSGLQEADIRSEWDALSQEYNRRIRSYGDSYGVQMGTTVTAMLLTPSRYCIMNVGDSRAYEINGGLRVMTKDQTLVAREVELGRLTPEQAEQDPRRSVLLQCIGASDKVVPDFFFGSTALNAVYMLCSDGFRHEITEQEIYGYLNPDRMVDADGMKQNMDMLIAMDKQRQERDNITAISVRTF